VLGGCEEFEESRPTCRRNASNSTRNASINTACSASWAAYSATKAANSPYEGVASGKIAEEDGAPLGPQGHQPAVIPLPHPLYAAAVLLALLVIILLVAVQYGIARWARARQARTGRDFPVWPVGFVLCGGLPIAALVVGGMTTTWDLPILRGFNYRGGFVLVPEFVALFAALSTYTAGFIAEVVRGGIQSVRQGQIDAAKALGLTHGRIVRLVVIPQAMPVIIPPITSQYLNLIKNSSFGAAIAYPEIVAVFMGSALVSTGQSIEIIAITLGIYLVLSLSVSVFMNWYNARHKLVTR